MPKQRIDRFAFLKADPSRMMLDLVFTADGGDIRNDKARDVRAAVLRAFTETVDAAGLEGCYTVTAKSMSPARFDAIYVRKFPEKAK